MPTIHKIKFVPNLKIVNYHDLQITLEKEDDIITITVYRENDLENCVEQIEFKS